MHVAGRLFRTGQCRTSVLISALQGLIAVCLSAAVLHMTPIWYVHVCMLRDTISGLHLQPPSVTLGLAVTRLDLDRQLLPCTAAYRRL